MDMKGASLRTQKLTIYEKFTQEKTILYKP